MHGSDLIDLCLTNIILVLFIFVDSFCECVYIYMYTFSFIMSKVKLGTTPQNGPEKDQIFGVGSTVQFSSDEVCVALFY